MIIRLLTKDERRAKEIVLRTFTTTRDAAQRGIDRLTKELGLSESTLRQREGDQPLPMKNDLPIVQDLVLQDIEARRQVGIKRYGTALQPHNGRDALRDMYEELLDAVMYARQMLYERDAK